MKAEAKTSPAKNGTEPSVGFAPVPVIILLLVGILFYFGQLYIDHYGGGFNAKVYQPYDSWKMVQDLQPKGADDLVLAKGKKVYETVCAACHQSNGNGAAGLAPPLLGSEWVLSPGPNRVVRIIHMGLVGPITVKGAPYNLAMPSMGRDAGLSDEDVAAVATFIRRNKEWGHSASLVTPEQVKAIRDEMKSRQTQWTAEELLAIPDK